MNEGQLIQKKKNLGPEQLAALSRAMDEAIQEELNRELVRGILLEEYLLPRLIPPWLRNWPNVKSALLS
jgi:hypothetical protein